MSEENTNEKAAENTVEQPAGSQPEHTEGNAPSPLFVDDYGGMKEADALGNEIGHCLFYLQMPNDIFRNMMAVPQSRHASIMSHATNGGIGGKAAVLLRAVRLMGAYEQACNRDDPYGAQERVNKKLSELEPYLPKPPSGPTPA